MPLKRKLYSEILNEIVTIIRLLAKEFLTVLFNGESHLNN